MKSNVPSKIFFTKGVGKHKDFLSSFEAALRSAGIEKCNLVIDRDKNASINLANYKLA